MKIPKKLTHFNLFLNSVSYAGKIMSLTLPKLEEGGDDYKSGGMKVPIPVESGEIEALVAEYTLSEYDPAVLKIYGFGAGPQTCVARGAMKLYDEVSSIVATMRGVITVHDLGGWESSGESELKFTQKCLAYKLEIDGQTIYDINAETMQFIVNGVDHMEKVRNGLTPLFWTFLDSNIL